MILLGSLIGIIIIAPINKKKSRRYNEKERLHKSHLMTENPLYLEGIRKFSSLTCTSDEQREEYESLLEEIESDMADN